ncbi:MAG: hypothetical protein IGR80_14010 [Synechococcales cyanobacterium K44_A2020_017]|nr:hypothetical protein [Synechococcales cyanobacterium K32_A2020_035]MBF2095859.1 hypothetical protein [Synechococcales cyanobacterium K44_A2020_017]
MTVYTARELYDQIRQRLEIAISDRTIREWRRKAFIEQKILYSETDVMQICRLGVFVQRTRNLKLAQQLLLEELSDDHQQRTVDVQARSIA